MVTLICILATLSVMGWEVWTRCHLGRKFATGRMCLQTLFLRTTRIIITADRVGQVIPVHDGLKMVHRPSGRFAYLPIVRPPRPRPPMPQLVRALVLTFFSL